MNITISSNTKKSTCSTEQPQARPQVQLYVIDDNYSELLLDELNNMNPCIQHTMAMAAQEKVIKKMTNNVHKHKCSDCIDLLLSTRGKINNEFIAMKNIRQPHESTVNIVVFANAVIRLIARQRNDFDAVVKTIQNNLDIDALFEDENLSEHQHELKQPLGHKEEFILLLVKIYMTLKSQKIAKKITDEERGELIRNRRKQDVHHAGQ